MNSVNEQQIPNKENTPSFAAKEEAVEPIKEELFKKPLTRPIQIEPFSFTRHGTSPQPLKPLKSGLIFTKKKTDSGSKVSSKEFQISLTTEDSPSSKVPPKLSASDNEPECQMTTDDERIYGKRFINGYERIKLLGKGGQGLVWLAKRKEDECLFAVKQIAIGGFFNDKTAKKELEIDEQIFRSSEAEDNLTVMGKNCLIRVLDHCQTQKDLFLVLELAGQCLSKHIYSMKGEFMKSERVYKVCFALLKITNNALFMEMRESFKLFRKVVTQMLLGLHSLASKQIVHCDLKPENILIKFDSELKTAQEVKIIDFGAAFEFAGSPFLTVTTPEYMPPDFLQLFSHRKNLNNRQKHDHIVKTCHSWSIDVWSLGVIIIEMLVGVPVWMSFKCRTNSSGKEQVTLGLFSSTSR